MSTTLKESLVITDGRIHEVISLGFSLLARDQNTWFELFKTKGYKRRSALADKALRHSHRFIHKEIKSRGLDWKQWRIESIGSNKLQQVIERRGQVYEIVKIS